MKNFEVSRKYAQSLDNKDKLASFREKFNFPKPRDGRNNIYLCGNSLGLQPKIAVNFVKDILTDWADLGVEGHTKGRSPWLSYHRLATKGFASLVGANEREVVAMNTLTVNLHILMASFYRPTSKKNKIVIESTAFPSDYYAVTSQLQLHGYKPNECLIEWKPRLDKLLHIDDLEQILEDQGHEIALVLLPGVQYYNGQVLDMEAACRAVQNAGCLIGLDLAHAIGNVPMQLHDWGPDFAAWCTYKYLNAGPGAVAGAFVHSRHLDGDGSQQLTGWWGNEEKTRFQMARTFEPANGVERWQLSNPPILAIAPIIASLNIFEEAGMEALREKSLSQTSYLKLLLDSCFEGQVETITPTSRRGCQLSLVITDNKLNGHDVFKALAEQHVTADWREPNVIRVAPAPLYNSYEDIYEFSLRLGTAINTKQA
ncbi:MAG: kynureninase [Woeseia sp.]|nr:kynureninase [Woeseia sp.]|tara:strand:- start:1753 stop:3033 length:1281 start_codon:yes stop_codon:yes gene_type:complete